MGAFPDFPRKVAVPHPHKSHRCDTPIANQGEKYSDKVDGGSSSVGRFRLIHITQMEEHVARPLFRCSGYVLRGEGIIIFNVWGRKIRDSEERLEVLIDDFYLVGKHIILGPFPTHLGGTRLGGTRLGETRFTGHS